jgi:translation initiation factor IF-1
MHNSERRQENVTIEEDGAAWIDGTVGWYGLQDLYRRKSWRKLSESAKRQAVIKRLPGDIDDVTVELTDSDDLTTNIGATYRYRRMDLATVAGDQILLNPTDYFARKFRFAVDLDRQHAVTLRYPFAVRSATTFTLPENWTAGNLPSKMRIEGPGMSFECLWSHDEAEGTLAWTGLLLVETIEISVEDYPALLQFVGSVTNVMRGGIVLTRSGE